MLLYFSQVAGILLINPLSDDLFELDSGSWEKHWYVNFIQIDLTYIDTSVFTNKHVHGQ